MVAEKIINILSNAIETFNDELLFQIERFYGEKEKIESINIDNIASDLEVNMLKESLNEKVDSIDKDKKLIEETIYKLNILIKEVESKKTKIPTGIEGWDW